MNASRSARKSLLTWSATPKNPKSVERGSGCCCTAHKRGRFAWFGVDRFKEPVSGSRCHFVIGKNDRIVFTA
jgi:hypothetical protein